MMLKYLLTKFLLAILSFVIIYVCAYLVITLISDADSVVTKNIFVRLFEYTSKFFTNDKLIIYGGHFRSEFIFEILTDAAKTSGMLFLWFLLFVFVITTILFFIAISSKNNRIFGTTINVYQFIFLLSPIPLIMIFKMMFNLEVTGTNSINEIFVNMWYIILFTSIPVSAYFAKMYSRLYYDAVNKESVLIIRARGIGRTTIFFHYVLLGQFKKISKFLVYQLGYLTFISWMIELIFGIDGIANVLYKAKKSEEAKLLTTIIIIIILTIMLIYLIFDFSSSFFDISLKKKIATNKKMKKSIAQKTRDVILNNEIKKVTNLNEVRNE